MRDNALYFPYISVPNDRWTIKTLLYWDKLSSIVPMDHIDNPEQLTPFMQSLVQEGLVQQVFPAHYLYEIPDFEKCFIELIEHRVKRRQTAPLQRAQRHTEKTQPRSTIHAEKLGEIPEFLIKNGLAKRVNWAWYEVESWVANLFMAYLASCLGALAHVNAAPVTNQTTFSRMFGNSSLRSSGESAAHHNKARDVILRSLLPVPDEKVTLDELLRFKDDHGHLLPALRRSIESHCSIIATLPNTEDRVLLTEEFIVKSKVSIDQITDAMKPTWSQVSFGSIAPLFGAGLTLHATPVSNEVAYMGSAFTLAACAYQAISSVRGNRDEELRKPLAYIAHANRRLLA
ncbi:DUF6236 family protein [Halopseudomonas laoshanensis]|uniref:DUF6236 family protein n=1 Tax=Halopseudomonas laoshanensis TaxID=2268758 RepID=UPI0011EE97FB|nr:DUF6236 family protein [Halopseudomonas laoshanensis]